MNYKHEFIGYTGNPVGTDNDPVEYRGFLIYERILTESTPSGWDKIGRRTYYSYSGTIFAVVKDGKELSQLAGPNGAKRAIDKHLSGEDVFKKLALTKN